MVLTVRVEHNLPVTALFNCVCLSGSGVCSKSQLKTFANGQPPALKFYGTACMCFGPIQRQPKKIYWSLLEVPPTNCQNFDSPEHNQGIMPVLENKPCAVSPARKVDSPKCLTIKNLHWDRNVFNINQLSV